MAISVDENGRVWSYIDWDEITPGDKMNHGKHTHSLDITHLYDEIILGGCPI